MAQGLLLQVSGSYLHFSDMPFSQGVVLEGLPCDRHSLMGLKKIFQFSSLFL